MANFSAQPGTTRVGWIGTGVMGRWMCQHLIENGYAATVYNRTREKAEALAQEFGVPAVYEEAEQLLQDEKPDFVDIITDASTHTRFVHLAAANRIPVICQKPMAPSLAEAQQMVAVCASASVPFTR